MSRTMIGLLALGAASGLAMGQAAFTLTSGDSSFGISLASSLGAPGGNANRTGAGGGAGANFTVDGSATDHLFQNWWWYRVGGGNREFAFSNFTGQSSGAANNQTLTYNEVDGVGASLTYVLQDQGVGAILEQRMVITNMSTAGPLTIDLFNYADFDVSGSAGGDSGVMMGADRMRITDGANFAEFQGVGANAWQATAFATLRGLLTNGVVDNLNNTGMPFGPGDWTGAFQWSSITLAPGQSFTAIERLSVNVAVPTPGAAALLGVAGLFGARRRR
ncbi:MAG: hypothetical protein AB7G17_03650 [Phycisphaerales bacterium]